MDAEQFQQRLLQQHNDNLVNYQQEKQNVEVNGTEMRTLLSTNGRNALLSASNGNATTPKHFYYIKHFADASRSARLPSVHGGDADPNISSTARDDQSKQQKKPPATARELRALLPLHIFIDRDYRVKNANIQFERDFPALLSRLRFPAERYFDAIDRLNATYSQLDKVSCRTISECLLNFFTCYACIPCTKSVYERALQAADTELISINREWASPEVQLGAELRNPRERGFRLLELIVYELPPDARDEDGLAVEAPFAGIDGNN